MQVLSVVEELRLPDWWIGAGFIRNKVWDYLHEYKEATPYSDIDVIYYEPRDFKKPVEEIKKIEKAYEEKLSKKINSVNWSVTNQIRMHHFKGYREPYRSSEDALSHWIETATCIGVKIDSEKKLFLSTPHGIEDLVHLKLRVTENNDYSRKEFYRRIKEKQWLKKWPKLTIIE